MDSTANANTARNNGRRWNRFGRARGDSNWEGGLTFPLRAESMTPPQQNSAPLSTDSEPGRRNLDDMLSCSFGVICSEEDNNVELWEHQKKGRND